MTRRVGVLGWIVVVAVVYVGLVAGGRRSGLDAESEMWGPLPWWTAPSAGVVHATLGAVIAGRAGLRAWLGTTLALCGVHLALGGLAAGVLLALEPLGALDAIREALLGLRWGPLLQGVGAVLIVLPLRGGSESDPHRAGSPHLDDGRPDGRHAPLAAAPPPAKDGAPRPGAAARVPVPAGAGAIRVSFERVMGQLPALAFSVPIETVGGRLQVPEYVLVPRDAVLPHLAEGFAVVDWHVVADQFPGSIFAVPKGAVGEAMPRGRLLLPIDEVVEQLPIEIFASALSPLDLTGLEDFPAPFPDRSAVEPKPVVAPAPAPARAPEPAVMAAPVEVAGAVSADPVDAPAESRVEAALDVVVAPEPAAEVIELAITDPVVPEVTAEPVVAAEPPAAEPMVSTPTDLAPMPAEPLAEMPAVEVPVAEAAVVETPVAEVAVAEAPVVQAPVAEARVADVSGTLPELLGPEPLFVQIIEAPLTEVVITSPRLRTPRDESRPRAVAPPEPVSVPEPVAPPAAPVPHEPAADDHEAADPLAAALAEVRAPRAGAVPLPTPAPVARPETPIDAAPVDPVEGRRLAARILAAPVGELVLLDSRRIGSVAVHVLAAADAPIAEVAAVAEAILPMLDGGRSPWALDQVTLRNEARAVVLTPIGFLAAGGPVVLMAAPPRGALALLGLRARAAAAEWRAGRPDAPPARRFDPTLLDALESAAGDGELAALAERLGAFGEAEPLALRDDDFDVRCFAPRGVPAGVLAAFATGLVRALVRAERTHALSRLDTLTLEAGELRAVIHRSPAGGGRETLVIAAGGPATATGRARRDVTRVAAALTAAGG